jgi:PKD repeat protein
MYKFNHLRIALLFAYILVFFNPFLALSQTNDTAVNPYWVEMMQNEKVNFFQTQRAFETYWEGREVTKGSGFKPFKRWEYMMSQRVSPDGTRPSPDREIVAYNDFLQKYGKTRNLNGDWTALGPFTVPSGYNGYRGLGRLNAIAFHPSNPDIIYVGAPSGGLWVSYDHGTNWIVLTDHLPTLGISSIIIDYNNPSVLYIGTGDRDAGDAPGLGVWRSIDGGISWEPWSNGMGNVTVGRMVQHPVNSEIMLAATNAGVFRTNNGGLSWMLSRNGNFKEIVLKPDNPDVVYAAIGGTFYKSIDNGISFSAVSNGLPGGSRGVIGVSAANPEIVYFLLTNSDSFKGIYRSENAGESFTLRSNSPNIMAWDCNGGSGGQAWYDLDMAVDPANADVIYGGGVNCFKSSNGGLSWAIRSHWYGACGVQSVHADLHVLEYSPINNRLYAGNDGGLYWSDNGGVNWTEISNGLVISQAYKIGQSATNKDFVINGYQDNGTSVINESNWVAVGGGDGMECAYDPFDARYSYYTLYYGDVFRNFNNNSNGKIAGSQTNGITESGGWVTPFIIDHNDGNVMFIGFKNIWRSTNIKASPVGNVQWEKVSTMNTSNFNVLAQSYANTNIIYAASGNKLYFSENVKGLSVNWINRTGNLPAVNSITAIETHPTDENVVYIAQQTRIFKSIDKGVSWQEITANLSGIQINSIAYYKNSNEGLYLGTDIAVFYRDNSMSDWILFNSGLPASVKVTEVEIFYDPLSPEGDLIRAGTYGRGLWSSPPYLSTLAAAFSSSLVTVTAGCTVDFYDETLGIPQEWTWTFEGGNPAFSNERFPTGILYENEGVFDVQLIVTNALGSDTLVCSDCITVTAAAAPVANFEASKLIGCAGMVVELQDLSENCPSTWNWEFIPADVSFLNETSSYSKNPVVQFNQNTTYSVKLTVSNHVGDASKEMNDYILVGGYSMPYEQSFDVLTFGEIGWEVENPDGLKTWEIQTLGNGSRTAWMNFFSYNYLFRTDYLISPPLNLEGMQNAYISFDYAYAQKNNRKDSLRVSVSTDCGITWERVYSNGPNGQGIFETTFPTTLSFVPQQIEDWCSAGTYGAPCPVIDISQYAGISGLKIRFEAYNHFGNNLYLSNMHVSQLLGIFPEEKTSSEMQLYPNPASSNIIIRVPDQAVGSEIVFRDIQGIILKRFIVNASETEISTDGFIKGIYFVEIKHKSIAPKKLIIH